ncbi:class I SAM-dependent DNA methyltransferase [Streptomyces sp. NPDC050145]|uniref:class I SAM-dependent DNA methyltransferase n=1 Tax=Streptomyces sp. NPDC050145 TaxID=3365602 RepID=UPI0037A43EB0
MTDISATAATDTQLATTARAYDHWAEPYTELVRTEFDRLPLDRAMFAAFADTVRAESGGPVVELGCGPGRLTAHLRDLGLDASGIDLSPVMIDIARRTYPDLRFEVGSMHALDLPDGSLAGAVSWYSVIHALPEDVPGYFGEFARVLRPGGHLLVGFFESEGGPVTPFDHKVTTAYRWPVDEVAHVAAEQGFTEIGRMLREPREGERFRRGHLLLRKGDLG